MGISVAFWLPLFISLKILLGKFFLAFFPYDINRSFANSTQSFIQGHAILIALISLSFCLSLGIRFWLKAENARRDAWAAEHNMQPEDMTREQKLAERHMGDYASFFRYTL